MLGAFLRTTNIRSALVIVSLPLIFMLSYNIVRSLVPSSVARYSNIFRTARSFPGSLTPKRAMHITSVPLWVGSSNNYAYIVKDDKTNEAVVIDPANPPEIAPVLKEKVDNNEIKLTAIINTHHHWDHSGGNEEILKQFPSIPVVGGKDCKAVTRTPPENETFKIGSSITVTPIYTPCHTQDSICWFMEDAESGDKAVFTGDTLFIGGCGKFFEGTPSQMSTSLSKLALLPPQTTVYPGHEYTASNVRFLKSIAAQAGPIASAAIEKLDQFAQREKVTTGKTTIKEEKEWNLFLRADTEEMRGVTGEEGKVEVLGKLRSMKDNFK